MNDGNAVLAPVLIMPVHVGATAANLSHCRLVHSSEHVHSMATIHVTAAELK